MYYTHAEGICDNHLETSGKYTENDACLICKTHQENSENKKETNYKIPESVNSIKNHAFLQCNNLTSITIPKSVTTIGDNAFQFCANLNSITIGKGVNYISNVAFANCENLAEVTFLGNAPKIGGEIFYESTPTIYRKPEAKGWGDTFGGRPVKLISEKL